MCLGSVGSHTILYCQLAKSRAFLVEIYIIGAYFSLTIVLFHHNYISKPCGICDFLDEISFQ